MKLYASCEIKKKRKEKAHKLIIFGDKLFVTCVNRRSLNELINLQMTTFHIWRCPLSHLNIS